VNVLYSVPIKVYISTFSESSGLGLDLAGEAHKICVPEFQETVVQSVGPTLAVSVKSRDPKFIPIIDIVAPPDAAELRLLPNVTTGASKVKAFV
jgi:hypothetical protein